MLRPDGGSARDRGREPVPGARLPARCQHDRGPAVERRDHGRGVREDLDQLPGIGEDWLPKIKEIPATWASCAVIQEVEARTPSTLAALTSIPGLGPKRVHVLHEALGVNTVEELLAAAMAGRVRELPRFSATIEGKIIEEIAKHRQTEQRFRIATAEDFAVGLVEHLRADAGRRSSSTWPAASGGVPRRSATSDILVASTDAPAAAKVLRPVQGRHARQRARRITRCAVVLQSGLQVDLPHRPRGDATARRCITSPARRPTTSRSAPAAPRSGLKVNEYGVFRGKRRHRRARARRRSSRRSACPGSRPSCARTAARSRPRAQAACRSS